VTQPELNEDVLLVTKNKLIPAFTYHASLIFVPQKK
jgi:hypothetical protein